MIGWEQIRSAIALIKTTLPIAGLLIVPLLLVSISVVYADGWLPQSSNDLNASQADNKIKNNTPTGDAQSGFRVGGIANTRHNLTMSYNNLGLRMDEFRNNYYEICVYCHTPHGANSTAAAPIWNRTVQQREYTLYNVENEPTALDLNYTQPGPNSLTCLSCHDGATAIDSIINMPTQLTGEFRAASYDTKNAAGYNGRADNGSVVNANFLNSWSNNKLVQEGKNARATVDFNPGTSSGHAGFNSNTNTSAQGTGNLCISCHFGGVNAQGAQGPDFGIFSIGDKYSDYNASGSNVSLAQRGGFLGDDHPIGVQYPKEFGTNVDYNEPDVKAPKIAFFDINGNGHADPDEVRLYDTGDGYEVECGSCHDPHGIKVKTEGADELIPSFLRVGSFNSGVARPAGLDESRRVQVSGNNGSALCLTCHVK